jgi:hypothetical protein
MPPRAIACGLFALAAVASASAEEPPSFHCLAQAYPDAVRGFADGALVLRDGTTLRWDDGVAHKSADQRIDDPDLDDMFAVPYRAGAEARAPDDDPGRARVTALFDALYGKDERAVRAALEDVAWLPRLGGKHQLPFNGRHGAAAALRRVSDDLERLPAPLRRYFATTAGTFNHRAIAGTARPSAHSWGIAIDLDTTNADYWRWNARPGGALPYRNRIPIEIVRVFERHGFIWGGRWRHYDTMHFEYRPELLRCTAHEEVAR